MFEFLNKLNKNKNNLSNICFSDDFKDFLKSYKLNSTDYLFDYSDITEICYIDISDKDGYLKFIPTSKYFNILKKYKKDFNKSSSWYSDMKNDFMGFYDNYNQKDNINNNIQLIKSGRFINKIMDDITVYDVESFVIRYKYYQKNKQNGKIDI